MKGEQDSARIRVGDINTPLSIMDRTTTGNRELNTINQLDVMDIYRTVHPTSTAHPLFSSAYGTSSMVDHMLGHRLSLNIYKKIDFIQSIFSDPNRMKLEINNRNKTGKFTDLWKLNNTLLNYQWVKEEIMRKLESIANK